MTGLRCWKQSGPGGCAAPARVASRGFCSSHNGKVDFSLRDFVEVVREAVFSDQRDDLHNLSVGETGIADSLDVAVADVTALLRHLGRELDGRVRLGIAGLALAVQRDFLWADLRQIQAEIGMS